MSVRFVESKIDKRNNRFEKPKGGVLTVRHSNISEIKKQQQSRGKGPALYPAMQASAAADRPCGGSQDASRLLVVLTVRCTGMAGASSSAAEHSCGAVATSTGHMEDGTEGRAPTTPVPAMLKDVSEDER